MIDMEKIATSIVRHLGYLTVDETRCRRIKSPISSCNACIKVCPTDSVRISQNRLEVGNCKECGLCASVCPTGALTWREPSPLLLAKKLEETIDKYQQAIIYCSNAYKGKVSSLGIEVPCFGSISWENWLEVLIYGEKVKVLLPEGNCLNCSIGNIQYAWKQLVGEASQYIKRDLTIISRLKESKNIAKPNNIRFNKQRRMFLGAIVGELGRLPETISKNIFDKGQTSDESSIVYNNELMAERRQVLLNVLNKHSDVTKRVMIETPIMIGNCYFCEACTILCPQGALRQKQENGKVNLQLNPVVCSGCGLCAELCFHKAIQMKSVQLIELNDKEVLIEGQEFLCRKCGNKYVAVEQSCPMC